MKATFVMNYFAKQLKFASQCGKDLEKTNYYFFRERDGKRRMCKVVGTSGLHELEGATYIGTSSNGIYPVFSE